MASAKFRSEENQEAESKHEDSSCLFGDLFYFFLCERCGCEEINSLA